MNTFSDEKPPLIEDPRFLKAVDLFNQKDWYSSHDFFEEIWHESHGPERITIQGILQVAVAQLHLESGNKNGATILYGEGLGRLRMNKSIDLGIDLESFCISVNQRLSLLQSGASIDESPVPSLKIRAAKD
ncbi:DUF309 domain-containing protein [Prochlorococcus sp. MIT 1300]|uniref:DUF309 domain-containing protein n=1 Tax=Prochlorococcus sp. MIT 1300 TaxID=3096218 RepID=UPI002A748B9E|nr:DUF309 domain-containing protein [Prochlorococcus sp. MIT 1300]